MSFIKKLASETAIYGVSNILNRLLNFIIITPYLTRVFRDTQGEYGIHGLMYAFAGFLMVMLTYGMETAFFRFGNKAENKALAFSTASISLLVSTLFFVSGLVFFSPSIAGILTRPEDAIYVVYFAFIIGFDVLGAIPFALMRLDNRPIRFAIIKTINILVNGGCILFFLEICPLLMENGVAWAGDIFQPGRELHYVFIANLVASAVTLLLLLPYYFKIKLAFDRALWLKMIRYAMPLVVVGIAGMINQLADRYLLKELLPGTLEENLIQLGIYNACIKIAVLMSLFIQAFRYAAEPFFFSHSEHKDARKIYAQVGQAFALVGSIGFLVIMLYLDFFKHLIASTYWEGLKIVPVLLLAYLFLGLYYSLSVWYKLTDKTHLGAYISLIGAVITLSLNFILIPKMGYMGAAWAAFSCFGVMMVVSYGMGQRYYAVPYPVGRMVGYVVLAVTIYGISYGVGVSIEMEILGKTAFHTGLIVVYLGGIVALERKKLKRWIN